MNKRIVFTQPYAARLMDAPAPEIGDDGVLVKTHYTAISAGTERANLIGADSVSGANRDAAPSFPACVGYSGAGVVEKAGANVKDIAPGDRVATCWGKHALYNALDRANVVKIPYDNIPLNEACFLLIQSFSLAAVRKTRLELGESCLVVGAGLLGLFAMQFARLAGGLPVIASDINADRRALAIKLGADAALDPRDSDYDKRLMELTRGKGADAIIEVTGNPAAMNKALRSAARFGRVALLGCTRRPVEADFYHDVHYPGLTLIGAHTHARPRFESSPGCWTEADDCDAILRFMAKGCVNVSGIISETHSPEAAPEVFNRLAYDNDFPPGVVFDWRGL